MGKAKSSGKAVAKESGTFLIKVVGKFVKSEVGFGGKVAKTANGSVRRKRRKLLDKSECVRFFGRYLFEVEVVQCVLDRR